MLKLDLSPNIQSLLNEKSYIIKAVFIKKKKTCILASMILAA